MSTYFLRRRLIVLLLLLAAAASRADDKPLTPLRVGVLEFGTVSWELELIQSRELAKKRGIDLKIVPLASAGEQLATGEFTSRYAKLVEEQIRAAPADWPWSHKRWKLKKPLYGP